MYVKALRDSLALAGAGGGGGARAVQHLQQLARLSAHARVHVHLRKQLICTQDEKSHITHTHLHALIVAG